MTPSNRAAVTAETARRPMQPVADVLVFDDTFPEV